MSTTRNRSGARRLTTLEVVGVAASVLLGAVVWTVGLPGSASLFGTPLSDLAVPVALFVALTGAVRSAQPPPGRRGGSSTSSSRASSAWPAGSSSGGSPSSGSR